MQHKLMTVIAIILGFVIGAFFGPTKMIYKERMTFECPAPDNSADNSTVFRHGSYTGKREWKS